MNVLTMALVATLLAGGSPEKVSGEVEQRLDLRGCWEGTYQHNGVVRVARLEQGQLRVAEEHAWSTALWKPEVAWRGKCRIDTGYGFALTVLYKVDGDRVLMCHRDDREEPSSFLSSGPHWLLTLRRAKSRK